MCPFEEKGLYDTHNAVQPLRLWGSEWNALCIAMGARRCLPYLYSAFEGGRFGNLGASRAIERWWHSGAAVSPFSSS